MKRYYYHKRPVLLNITPLIDILFVVVIFFSLGTQIKQTTQIPLILPESSSAEQSANKQSLIIRIDAQNNIYLGGQEVSVENLENTILSQNYDAGETTELEIDKNVTHGFIVRVLDILRANRFTKISFLTREKG